MAKRELDADGNKIGGKAKSPKKSKKNDEVVVETTAEVETSPKKKKDKKEKKEKKEKSPKKSKKSEEEEEEEAPVETPVEEAAEVEEETEEDHSYEKKAAPVSETPAEGEFADEELTCRDCSEPFTFTAGEQEFFASKGFDNKPVRCKPCKEIKKGGGASGVARSNTCYAFQKGQCDRGDGCRFSHEEGGGGGGGGGAPARSFGGDRPRGVCYAFQEGKCSRGDECRFSHTEGGGGGGGGGGFGGDRPQGVCYDHQKGNCTRGDGCRFKHE